MKRLSVCALVLAMILTAAPVTLAAKNKVDPEDTPWDRLYVQLGAFLADLDSSFRIGAENLGIGIALDVEKFLGLDSSKSAFRFDAGWRFKKNLRHRLQLNWFSFKRSGTNTLTEDIEIGDEVILEGTTIESLFDYDLIKVKYAYSLMLDDRVDFFLGGGLYVLPIKFGLGEQGEDFTQEDVTAPLPVFTLGFNFALSEKWFLRQDIDFLYLNIMDVKGGIVDINFAVDRRLTKNLALGLGFEVMRINVEASTESDYPGLDFDGEFGFGYTGVQLYLKGNF
jgi:hypothetical protein